jgi:hypothetical protein
VTEISDRDAPPHYTIQATRQATTRRLQASLASYSVVAMISPCRIDKAKRAAFVVHAQGIIIQYIDPAVPLIWLTMFLLIRPAGLLLLPSAAWLKGLLADFVRLWL